MTQGQAPNCLRPGLASWERWLIVVVLVTSVVVGSALPAAAHSQPTYWKDSDYVGNTCGLNTGTYVKSWQSILWAEKYLGNLNAIDGIFGPQSHSATATFQYDHSLIADGCVGFYTWRTAQAWEVTADHRLYLVTPNVSCSPQGGIACDIYWWDNPSIPRHVAYKNHILTSRYCWELRRAVNESTLSEKIFNNIVNHGSLNTC